MLSFLTWKLTSFSVLDNASYTSYGVRFMEGKNLIVDMYKDRSLYFGRGLGGYFTDSNFPYMHTLRGTDSYSDAIIETREISNPHGTQFLLVLKLGIFGLLGWTGLLGMQWFKNRNRETTIILAIVMFLFYKAFTLKVQVLLGVFIYIFFYETGYKKNR